MSRSEIYERLGHDFARWNTGHDIDRALKTLSGYGFPTPSTEAVEGLKAELKSVLAWLEAERLWEADVRAWLREEQRYVALQSMQTDSVAYQAAKRGWLAMRELAPNLDGAPAFENLSLILQDRYLAFAQSVLGWPSERLVARIEG